MIAAMVASSRVWFQVFRVFSLYHGRMNQRKPLLDRNADWDQLAPFVAERGKLAIAECRDNGYQIALFEGLRSPQRQDWLYAIGRTEPGKKVTNVKGYGSWHVWGLAIDIAYFDGKRWSWPKEEDAWDKPAAIFESHGFEWLFPYERVHFQITGGLKITEAREFESKEDLWDLVHARLMRQTNFDH